MLKNISRGLIPALLISLSGFLATSCAGDGWIGTNAADVVGWVGYDEGNIDPITGELEPADGVVVTLTDYFDSTLVYTATTDVDGYFSLPQVKESTYNLLMEKSGFQTMELKGVVFSYDTMVKKGTLNLGELPILGAPGVFAIREPEMNVTVAPFNVTLGRQSGVVEDGINLVDAKYSLSTGGDITVTYNYVYDTFAKDIIGNANVQANAEITLNGGGNSFFNPVGGAQLKSTTTDGKTWTISGAELKTFLENGVPGVILAVGDQLEIVFGETAYTPIRGGKRNMPGGARLIINVTP